MRPSWTHYRTTRNNPTAATMTTPAYPLSPTAARIYAAVLEAMQAAEEIDGPEHIDYLHLMSAIKHEADDRAANAIQGMIDEAEQTRRRPAIDGLQIANARRMVAQLAVADTREQLAALYLDWIGYSPLEEAQDSTPIADEMRDTLRDYIKEVCYATGVPCSIAGLPDA